MNPAQRYIDNVLAHVYATDEDRERLAVDLRSHFAEGKATGRTPPDIIAHLGTAEEVAAAFNAERQLSYASFWERLVAFLADAGLLMTVSLPVLGLFFLNGRDGSEPAEPTLFWFLSFILAMLMLAGVAIFYFPLLESHFGRTLGKHLMRLRVRREDGTPIGLGQAFVRRLSMYFDMLWVDALFVPFTGKRQRALDIVAKTIVVHEPGEKATAGSYLLCLLLAAAPFCALICAFLVLAPQS